MSKYRAKGLCLALESEGEAEAETTSEETMEAMEDATDAVNELQEPAEEVDDLTYAADDAVEDMDSLEDIQDVMQESVDKGEGLDETSAKIAEVAIESIREKLGMPKTAKFMPATESFGSTNSRVAATNIAIESIGDMLKTAWEAIIKAIKTTWETISGWFDKYFSAAGKLKSALDKLKEELKGIDMNKVKTVEMPETVKAFNFGGSSGPKLVIEILGSHNSMAGTVSVQVNILTEVVKLLDGVSASGKMPGENGSKDVVSAMTNGFSKVSTATTETVQGGKNHIFNFERLGFGKDITIIGHEDASGLVFFEKDMKAAEAVKDNKISTPNKTQTAAIVGLVGNILTAVEGQKSLKDTFKKDSDKLIKSAEDLIKKIDSDKSELKKEDVAKLRKFVTSSQTVTKFISIEAGTSNIAVARAALSYVSKSAKEVKKETK